MVTHPYSIYIWQAAHGVRDQPAWYEAFQAYTEDDVLYTANLIHTDSNDVIKVVRYGLNLACFPDEHTVELCKRQITKQGEPREVEEPDITFFPEWLKINPGNFYQYSEKRYHQ